MTTPQIGDVWELERYDIFNKIAVQGFPKSKEIVTVIGLDTLEASQYGSEVLLFSVINSNGVKEKIPEWCFRKDGQRISSIR